MAVLTDLAQAQVKDGVRRLYGITLTRPALLVSDGLNEVYACDVHITQDDPTGKIHQYYNERHKKKDFLTGLPGQRPEDWQLDDSLPGHVDTTLRNVAVARNNVDLIYADVGNPVICERTENGQWQIVGFSMERPGSHMLYPVDLGDMTIGTVIDLSVDTRLLTLAEIGEFQPFGVIAFGASAIFEGGDLVRFV
jgi:hypothetical protein